MVLMWNRDCTIYLCLLRCLYLPTLVPGGCVLLKKIHSSLAFNLKHSCRFKCHRYYGSLWFQIPLQGLLYPYMEHGDRWEDHGQRWRKLCLVGVTWFNVKKKKCECGNDVRIFKETWGKWIEFVLDDWWRERNAGRNGLCSIDNDFSILNWTYWSCNGQIEKPWWLKFIPCVRTWNEI